MQKLTFSTNIMCGSCLNKVKPKLDGSKQVKEWSVDTTAKDKLLSVSVVSGTSAEDVITTVRAAGFTAAEVKK